MTRKNPSLEDRKPRLCACGDHVWASSTKGFVILADPADKGILEDRRWFAQRVTRKDAHPQYYPRTGTKINGKNVVKYLHHEIMEAVDGFHVDHKNHNGFDNRRSNLRYALPRQNKTNSKRVVKEGKKLPRGVFRVSKSNTFYASIGHKNEKIILGHFSCPIEAARAYDKAARRLHGEFSTLNNL